VENAKGDPIASNISNTFGLRQEEVFGMRPALYVRIPIPGKQLPAKVD